MKPLSVFYDQEVAIWLRSNPGRIVTQCQVSKLHGSAFVRAATMITAINGFRKTGIWPVNPYVFGEHDYAPSETTDRPVPPSPDEAPSSKASDPIVNQPTTSHDTEKNIRKLSFTPEDILPIPSCSGLNLKKKTLKQEKTAILTESLYKNELQMEIDSKAQKKTTKKGSVKKNNIFTTEPTADLVTKEKQVNCKSSPKKSIGMSLGIKRKSERLILLHHHLIFLTQNAYIADICTPSLLKDGSNVASATNGQLCRRAG
ncbi:hypothetical protein ANN_10667 [Periplaneta americana]|uniref:Uncharacterized protein n=1 Tax=Periplaneta americana TaxID=6978 RepID=A0ABQ8T4A2_PERAM|nr:hypothetical protein ANN_10667 [Periplaneta americana]